jgi:hypothetical protein
VNKQVVCILFDPPHKIAGQIPAPVFKFIKDSDFMNKIEK